MNDNELVKKFPSLPYKIEAPEYIVARYKLILRMFEPKKKWEWFMIKMIADYSELEDE